ncbi:MAG: hypothetical protein VBE63_12680 [Lamprobacter sp.]|uniref:hypothetical protein n=1 Tax=Lamprobacter sp. TaxID=3100796 RepID=UPI002B25F16B|nr:hypothetical protein [Lamprobacter sp.]MEA3640783.1 hypothetical protein [Lamprobacter sp.]
MTARHPDKHIRAAIAYALEQGWRLTKASGHAHIWGKLSCPLPTRDGCLFNIHSTPSHPQAHAARIRRAVDHCHHGP